MTPDRGTKILHAHTQKKRINKNTDTLVPPSVTESQIQESTFLIRFPEYSNMHQSMRITALSGNFSCLLLDLVILIDRVGAGVQLWAMVFKKKKKKNWSLSPIPGTKLPNPWNLSDEFVE